MTPGSVQPGTGSARSKAPVATTRRARQEGAARLRRRGRPPAAAATRSRPHPRRTARPPHARARSGGGHRRTVGRPAGRPATCCLKYCPPRAGRSSTSTTCAPASAATAAAVRPPAPPPTTSTSTFSAAAEAAASSPDLPRAEAGSLGCARRAGRRSWSCRRAGSGGRRSRPGSPGRRPCRRTARARSPPAVWRKRGDPGRGQAAAAPSCPAGRRSRCRRK